MKKEIAHYQILEKLGEGGMGEVYLAEDTLLKRNVALKFLSSHITTNSESIERFKREAQAAAALNHPNIITIYEIREFEEKTFIAMEYVDGFTLRSKIEKGILPFELSCSIAIQLCQGLGKAHRAGIIHRDIKPENIMLDYEDRIKILDEKREEVPDGEVGEIFYRTPEIFKEYLKEPEKTREAFHGGWSSAGDMGYRDEDGYYVLVDRKANMIITGGENVYPSEVENAIGAHAAVRDIAVIGIPDDKWGEAVKAIVVLNDGYDPGQDLEKDILAFTKDKLAGYKRPKSIDFIQDDDMPRTPTGKILHRILREQHGKWSDG